MESITLIDPVPILKTYSSLVATVENRPSTCWRNESQSCDATSNRFAGEVEVVGLLCQRRSRQNGRRSSCTSRLSLSSRFRPRSRVTA
jgi:hypothetical protein